MTSQSPPAGRAKGTSVVVSLPIVESPTLLVVDDDEAVLALLSEQLSGQGYHVIRASDGIEALDKVRQERPDMVILDLVLPGMEGSEVILQMRSDKNLMRIPVIVITGANVGGAKAEILSSFSIPALSKPWQESELLDRVEGAFLGATAFSR